MARFKTYPSNIDISLCRSFYEQNLAAIFSCHCFTFLFTNHSFIMKITFVTNNNNRRQLARTLSILRQMIIINCWSSSHTCLTLTLLTLSNLSSTSAKLPLKKRVKFVKLFSSYSYLSMMEYTNTNPSISLQYLSLMPTNPSQV